MKAVTLPNNFWLLLDCRRRRYPPRMSLDPQCRVPCQPIDSWMLWLALCSCRSLTGSIPGYTTPSLSPLSCRSKTKRTRSHHIVWSLMSYWSVLRICCWPSVPSYLQSNRKPARSRSTDRYSDLRSTALKEKAIPILFLHSIPILEISLLGLRTDWGT